MLHAIQGEVQSATHKRALFALVLVTGFDVDEFCAELDNRKVIFEELWEVECPSVALLVEIDRADAILVLFKVWCDLDDVVVGSHVAEQVDEAALVELDEFFGEPDFMQVGAGHVVVDEVVAGTPIICSSMSVSSWTIN